MRQRNDSTSSLQRGFPRDGVEVALEQLSERETHRPRKRPPMDRYIGLDAHASSCMVGVVGLSGKRLGSHVVETNAPVLLAVRWGRAPAAKNALSRYLIGPTGAIGSHR